MLPWDGDGDGLRTPAAARALGTHPSHAAFLGGGRLSPGTGRGSLAAGLVITPSQLLLTQALTKTTWAPHCRLCLQL